MGIFAGGFLRLREKTRMPQPIAGDEWQSGGAAEPSMVFSLGRSSDLLPELLH